MVCVNHIVKSVIETSQKIIPYIKDCTHFFMPFRIRNKKFAVTQTCIPILNIALLLSDIFFLIIISKTIYSLVSYPHFSASGVQHLSAPISKVLQSKYVSNGYVKPGGYS